MKRICVNIFLVCSLAACVLTACTDVWDEHYQTNPALAGEKNLWELISSNPELTEFAVLLEATGYDSLLTMNRCYTVWAPTVMPEDFSLEGASDSLLDVYRKEIVENHIANFSHIAGGIRDKDDKETYSRLTMLNGKFCDFTGSVGSGYQFSEKKLKSSNIIAKNGVLHVIDGYAWYPANLWELLAGEERVRKLFAFLEKDHKYTFNPNASTPGSIVNGQQTYLDSVFTESCRWFYELGQFKNEDSLYTMYAFTDKAWDEMYKMMEGYFEYMPGLKTKPELGNQTSEELTDSLVKELICRNLVFSQTVNRKYYQGERDSLYSTTGRLFPGDTARMLDNGSTIVKATNGTLHIVDQVNYLPYTWGVDKIHLEGESLLYAGNEAYDPLSNHHAADSRRTVVDKDSVLYDHISGGAVGVILPGKETSAPEMNFYIDNIFSGYYKVSIVLLRPNVLNDKDNSFIKPNKFNAILFYADGTHSGYLGVEEDTDPDPSRVAGTVKDFVSFDINSLDVLPLNRPDTIVLAECIRVPYCEYNLNGLTGNKRQTRLNLTTKITFGSGPRDKGKVDNYKTKSVENWKYDNSYRIDQVIFEPIQAPANE